MIMEKLMHFLRRHKTGGYLDTCELTLPAMSACVLIVRPGCEAKN